MGGALIRLQEVLDGEFQDCWQALAARLSEADLRELGSGNQRKGCE